MFRACIKLLLAAIASTGVMGLFFPFGPEVALTAWAVMFLFISREFLNEPEG